MRFTIDPLGLAKSQCFHSKLKKPNRKILLQIAGGADGIMTFSIIGALQFSKIVQRNLCED